MQKCPVTSEPFALTHRHTNTLTRVKRALRYTRVPAVTKSVCVCLSDSVLFSQYDYIKWSLDYTKNRQARTNLRPWHWKMCIRMPYLHNIAVCRSYSVLNPFGGLLFIISLENMFSILQRCDSCRALPRDFISPETQTNICSKPAHAHKHHLHPDWPRIFRNNEWI